MEFVCSRDNLLKGVQAVDRVVSTKSSLPIIGNILFDASRAGLTLSANNLEMGIEFSIQTKVSKEGSVLIPAKTLSGLVSKLPSGDISFKVSDKNTIKIAYNDSYFVIHGLPPDEFPSLPKIKDGRAFELDPELLLSMIKQTIFSVSTSDEKYVLNGVLLEAGKGEGTADTSDLRLVATDGYRLSRRGAKVGIKGIGEARAIIPAKALSEIGRAIQDGGDKTVRVTLAPEQIAFKYNDVYVVSRLIQGQFPDYKQVIPKSSEAKITVSTKELLEAAERASVIAQGNANIVKFEVKPGELHIIANTPDVGSIDESIKVDVKGKDRTTVAFNVRLITDMLKGVTSENVMLELSGPLSPGVIKPAQGDDHVYIVMPIRTAEAA